MNLKEGILAVDVGSGTQDILVWQSGVPMGNCPKMIFPSPTSSLASMIVRTTEKGHHIFFSGKTMGGGPCSLAVRRHLKAGFKAFALKEPALTFHDDLEKVQDMGIQVVESRPDIDHLTELMMGDVHLDAIYRVLDLFNVSRPGIIAVSVQDHGFSQKESNRVTRFRQWSELLRSGDGLESLLYKRPPRHLTRMRAVGEAIPEAFIMDTGASAILGVLMDPWVSARREEGVTVVNVGNSHTVAALIKGDKIWGIYEHHTSMLTSSKLKEHLERFPRDLTNKEIFDDMGHGCAVLPGVDGAGSFRHLCMTGPRREKFLGLQGHMAAPFGDMMLTGCFGLVEAIKKVTSQKVRVKSMQ